MLNYITWAIRTFIILQFVHNGIWTSIIRLENGTKHIAQHKVRHGNSYIGSKVSFFFSTNISLNLSFSSLDLFNILINQWFFILWFTFYKNRQPAQKKSRHFFCLWIGNEKSTVSQRISFHTEHAVCCYYIHSKFFHTWTAHWNCVFDTMPRTSSQNCSLVVCACYFCFQQ